MFSDKKRSLLAKIALFCSSIVWGSSFFILKNTLDTVPMYFLLTIRFLAPAVLMSIVFFKKWKLCNREYLIAGAMSGLFCGLAYIFQTVGLKHTTPGVNAFLTAGYCVQVPFMMWVLVKKKPNLFNIIAAVLCIAGIGLVSLDGGGFGFSFKGEGYTLICSVFFALQIVVIGRWGNGKDSILFTIIQFYAAALVMLVCYLIFERTLPTSMNANLVLSLIYLSVGATGLAFLCMTIGIKYASANSASIILSLEAVFGVAFSMLFYKERLTVQTGIGFLVIFLAVITSETGWSFLFPKKKAVALSADIQQETLPLAEEIEPSSNAEEEPPKEEE